MKKKIDPETLSVYLTAVTVGGLVIVLALLANSLFGLIVGIILLGSLLAGASGHIILF